jgi:hypothetical protein
VRSLSLRNELVVGSFKYEDPYNGEPFPAGQITPELWITAVTTEARWRSYDEGKHYFLTDSKMYPAMWLTSDAKDSNEGRRVMELLNLQPDPLRRVWPFKLLKTIDGPDLNIRPDSPRQTLMTRMRSFYGVMNLLSNGVQVPEKDQEEGLAFSTDRFAEVVAEGKFEDLTKYFAIRSHKTRPESAFIAVPYRNHWFSIDDADLASKRIFNAIYDLFHLQVAPSGGSNSPVLTLPVK